MAHPCCLCGKECDCQRIADGLDFRTPDNCKGCGCDEDDFDDEFMPCEKCDGHDACADFGCAIALGLGRMVKNYVEPGNDKWS